MKTTLVFFSLIIAVAIWQLGLTRSAEEEARLRYVSPLPLSTATLAPPSSCALFGATPAGAGVITKMIPPYYTHGYGLKNT